MIQNVNKSQKSGDRHFDEILERESGVKVWKFLSITEKYTL